VPYIHGDEQNLYEMFYDVRRTLSEVTAAYWTDLEVYRHLNLAQRDIAIKSKCLKKTVTVTTTTSTPEYDLKDHSFADIIDIPEDGVYFKISGTTYSPLTYKSKKQLAMEFPGWQGTAASTPAYYYWDKSTKTIGLYPKPNSSNAGAYLFVTGYHYPKVLLAGTASAGATTSITFAAGSSTVPYPSTTNDYYNNLWIEIYSGTGAGQKVEITDYVASTRVVTVAITTAPDSSSIFGMIPQIPSSAHHLMPLYALWKLLAKGGSRVTLANNYGQQYMAGRAEFISEFDEDEGEEIIKDSYR
jgi:hypothetical protein